MYSVGTGMLEEIDYLALCALHTPETWRQLALPAVVVRDASGLAQG